MVGAAAAPSDGHTGTGASPDQLKGEQFWLDLWAYGRSPYGLGLAESEFWGLGFREFDALRREHRKHLRRWALELSLHANIWRKADSAPFTPEDFLDPASREKRLAEHTREQQAVQLANAQLAKITADTVPDDGIPDWAKGPYKGVN